MLLKKYVLCWIRQSGERNVLKKIIYGIDI